METLFRRYVCCYETKVFAAIFQFLKSIEPTVQFTQEIENDGVLAFLDVKLTRESTDCLDYTVYRKPTHTDRCLNFRSDRPLQHKKAVIKTLLCRAKLLTSNEANYQEEMDRIQLALKNNGYPPALTARSQISTNTHKMVENRSSVVLPYYRGLSEKLQSCLRDHKFKSFFKPMRTIDDKLRNGKDPVHPFDRHSALYCVPYGDCDQKCFGEIKKSFNTRKKEHINNIKHFHPEKSAVAKHTLELEHRMNWSKTQIVAFKNDFRKRRFIESFLINRHPTSLTKRVQIFFQTSTKRRLAIIDLIRDCMFLIRFDSTYSLFLTAVILFYSYSSSVIYCAFRNVVVSVITTSSYHARSVILLLSCSSRHDERH